MLNIENSSNVSETNVQNFSENDKCRVLSNRSILLVIAYMRSGSTLTASILRESERSFYVFEPLHNLLKAFKDAEQRNLDTIPLKYIWGSR
ncbi:hypothetical protein DPMN_046444 [Dreissena polymorpha]|uniref:Sulfotransferase n=1 Tax=Dreissena polymorpha TaxID=45954 RepID=A0A9D4D6S8_DREPO|nr:hypothetical protein DPMN_046444 [Dreissena polymorpha]